MEHRKLTTSEQYQERAYDKALYADLDRASGNWQSAFELFKEALDAQIRSIQLDKDHKNPEKTSAMLLHAGWLALEVGDRQYAQRLAKEGIRLGSTQDVTEELLRLMDYAALRQHGNWIWEHCDSPRLKNKIKNHKKKPCD